MKTLKDFTPEIQNKISTYIHNGTKDVFDGTFYKNFDLEKAKACVKWNYEKAGFEEPMVLVAENPYEVILLYKELLQMSGEKDIKKILSGISYYDMYLFTMNVYSNGYYQWYKFLKEEFKLPLTIDNDFEMCFKLQRESGIYAALFLQKFCIISKYPKKIHRDGNNLLHNTKGVAVEWGAASPESQFECYYIHGRNIPKESFLQAVENKITKKMWLAEKNEDIKTAWFEILGSENVMKILEAKEVDSTMQIHANGELEELVLYKTPFILKEIGEPLAWVKFICPSTESNYLISVNPKHKTVMEAVLDTCPFYGKEILSVEDYKFTNRG